MSDFDRYTRVNKFEKRRKNTKLLSMLLVAASFLIILLLGLWIFGPDDEPVDSDQVASSDTSRDDENIEGSEDGNLEEDTEDNSGIENEESSQLDGAGSESETDEITEENNENIETEPTEPSGEDDNVIEAFTGEWSPIGTEQEGPHTTQYDEETQDRLEMEIAIRSATGLTEDDMITWWLENGGDQKVIATVSNRSETATYRVYLSWIDNQGWQPTLVEVLKENDQKWRFE